MLLVTWMQFCKLSTTLLSINTKSASLADLVLCLLCSSGKMMFGQAICFLDTHCQWKNLNPERITLVGLGDNQSKQHLKLLKHHSLEARSLLILITSKVYDHSFSSRYCSLYACSWITKLKVFFVTGASKDGKRKP